MKSQFEGEEMLTGGNVSNVFRTADTVRRDLKPDSTKTHKLLQHLESKGFDYAPRFLGIDKHNQWIILQITSRLYVTTILLYIT